jgi:SAM-dependent methyltransferase
MKSKKIEDFWQNNPCGENLTGRHEDWKKHFELYDNFRYGTEGHILDELNCIDFNKKNVLEIGIGQASDSLQIAKRGATWSGIDLTEAAVFRANKRFEINDINFNGATVGNAENMPYKDNTFDIVYSHGVLHHIPNIQSVNLEISRVLKPNGKLVIMLYNKNSLNYWLSIKIIRRVGIVMIYTFNKLGLLRLKSGGVLAQHFKNVQDSGLLSYLKISNFIHKNTDGPDNPFSRVYDIRLVKQHFSLFNINKTKTHFLNLRHFPGIRFLPGLFLNRLESKYGWHLWIFLTNNKRK